jgi:DNA repair exonuclease SbcCD ATPase subunit
LKLKSEFLKNYKKITIITAIALSITGTTYASFKVIENKKKNLEAIIQMQSELSKLQKYKDEQNKIEAEKTEQEMENIELEKMRVEQEKREQEESQQRELTIQKCEERKRSCENKIDEIKEINFDGDYEDVYSLDDADSQIEELEDLIDRWKDQTSCNRSDDNTKKSCEELDERINQLEKDIKDIKELAKKAKSKISQLVNSSECKNYDRSCE